MRLIATIMGATDSKSRNSNMANLLDYGFNNYSFKNLCTENEFSFLSKINVLVFSIDFILKESKNSLPEGKLLKIDLNTC